MAAGGISTLPDGPRQSCCLNKRVIVLVALSFVAALSVYMYSMNCCKNSFEGPQVLRTSSNAFFRKTPLFAKVLANTRMPETTVNATTSEASADVQQPVVDHQFLPPHDLESSSVFSSLSSVYDNEDDDFDSKAEGNAFKPQGSLQRRLPKFIIIGIKKGGTRALLNFLKAHPQVSVATKEVHFFDRNRNYRRGLEWYRKAMPYTYENQLTAEKSPSYFVTPEVPKRIYSMSRNVKFLLITRDPVARAISDHAQSLSKGKTTPFEEKALLDPRKCTVDKSWSAIRIGQYSVHLRRWLEYFPIEQFFFVSGENLIANPGSEMEKVQDFLQIERMLTNDSFVFGEKGFPCLKGDNGEAQCLGKSKGRPHNPVEPRVRTCLTEFYRPYNEEFYNMTGINFHWGE